MDWLENGGKSGIYNFEFGIDFILNSVSLFILLFILIEYYFSFRFLVNLLFFNFEFYLIIKIIIKVNKESI